ncbi:MAG: Clp1/GlmU family protein [Chloroflexota bacterium]
MSRIEVPRSWENLRLADVSGVVLVVGATDTGKTTLARYLCRRLREHHDRVAFLDGDMGQATLGPPTTMTLALSGSNPASFPPDGPRFRTFVGDISPVGHMLPTVVGAHRLVKRGLETGASAIVVDTTGLVAPAQGGGALKRALVDLLRPQVVIGVQRGTELGHLLDPLRRSQRTRVIDRPVAEAVQRRSAAVHRAYRAEQYRRAFEQARLLEVDWGGLAVIPCPSFTQHRLVAFEDCDGFVLGLGIVTDCVRNRQVVELHTSLTSLGGVDTLHIGDVAVDPDTFGDERV